MSESSYSSPASSSGSGRRTLRDGTTVDIGALSPELRAYARTINVLTGNVMYSDSWLDD